MRPFVNILLSLLLLVLPDRLFAQTSNRPLNANSVSQLQFPRIAIVGAGAGSIRVDPVTEGSIIAGNVRILSGTSSPALLHIVGLPDSVISVRVPSSTDLVAPSGQIIRLQSLLSTAQSGTRLSPSGQARVKIGATLPVTAATSAGNYRGRVIVAIDYIFE
jgi:hypothetical protein